MVQEYEEEEESENEEDNVVETVDPEIKMRKINELLNMIGKRLLASIILKGLCHSDLCLTTSSKVRIYVEISL